MTEKEQKQEIVNKMDELCERLDAIRSFLDRGDYEMQSNILCGKPIPKDTLVDASTDIMNIANDIELAESKLQVELLDL